MQVINNGGITSEISFNFIAPYCTGENDELCFFGYLFKDNPEKGIVLDLIYDVEGRNAQRLEV